MEETELQQQITLLKQEYLSSIPDKVQLIVNLIDQTSTTPPESNLLEELHRLSHTLKGSASTFSYPDLARQAGEIENLVARITSALENNKPCSIEPLKESGLQLIQHSKQIQQDKEVSGLPIQSLNTTSYPRNKLHRIYLIEDDPHQAAEIKSNLTRAGYNVTSFGSTTAALPAIAKAPPSAMILDLALPEGMFAGPELAAQLRQQANTNLPFIFISARGDWEARHKAMLAGGEAYLTKPIDPAQLIKSLNTLLQEDDQEPYRVLIVEDDELLAEHYQLILSYAGLHTAVSTSPKKVLSIAARHQPELILMDLHMGSISGIEVAQVIRQHQQLFSIPIIFLSSEHNPELQQKAVLNGDHFVEKPISDEHLIELVISRSHRSRSLASMMYRDGLTGLLNQITLRHRLESELAYKKRHQQQLCFVMIDIDHFKQINDRYGHGTGDTVLKTLAALLERRLRQSDHIGRLGGEEFGFILPDSSLEQAYEITEQLREQFSELNHFSDGIHFQCSFSAGIACSTNHPEVLSLLEAADNNLYIAKQAGRNQTVSGAE